MHWTIWAIVTYSNEQFNLMCSLGQSALLLLKSQYG